MAQIICLDFDDTVVLDNTFRQVIERFGDVPAWRRGTAAARAGRELSVEQSNAAGLATIDPAITREQLEAYVLEVARVRPGLLELTDWAHWHGWLTIVVSLGFDFYVEPVMRQLGLDRVARHVGRTNNDYRWRVRYDSPRGIEVQDGFKTSYAAAFRAAGDFVVYCGDGASDVEPARMAGAVFARDTLWERLKDERERVYPFETFHDVIAVLDREAEAWLASFSSTTAAEA